MAKFKFINASLLTTKELEQFTQYFMEGIEEISVNYNESYVNLSASPAVFYQRQGKQFQKRQSKKGVGQNDLLC